MTQEPIMSGRLPTVLLHHILPTGSHYDWLFATPDDPAGLLWAGRVRFPVAHWLRMHRFIITVLPPHRRRYLRYQGRLTPKHGQNRGRVRRVAQGWLIPRLWTPARFVLEIHLPQRIGILTAVRLDARRWRARWTSLPGAQ